MARAFRRGAGLQAREPASAHLRFARATARPRRSASRVGGQARDPYRTTTTPLSHQGEALRPAGARCAPATGEDPAEGENGHREQGRSRPPPRPRCAPRCAGRARKAARWYPCMSFVVFVTFGLLIRTQPGGRNHRSLSTMNRSSDSPDRRNAEFRVLLSVISSPPELLQSACICRWCSLVAACAVTH